MLHFIQGELMNYTITRESFTSLTSYWTNPGQQLQWNSIFVLPTWLEVWWQEFGDGAELYLNTIRQGEKVIGMAPLSVRENTASFIGSANVCDYLDFVVAPGMEPDFFNILLDDLRQQGVRHLNLESLRPDSTVLTSLADIARNRDYEVLCQPEDVSLELELPSDWGE